ncbi:MAG: C40 family peptidase, partial [Lachnospiraceae bacterium]|nr:C40 family peptidase [Lachnospiraceae bacterium]
AEPPTEPVQPSTAEPPTEPVQPSTAEPPTEPVQPSTAEPPTEPVQPSTAEPPTEPVQPSTAEPPTEPVIPPTQPQPTEPDLTGTRAVWNAAEGEKGTVYETAAAGAAVVGSLEKGASATILEVLKQENGTWYRIRSGSVEGYASAEGFATGDAAEGISSKVPVATVSSDSLRLFEAADTDSRTLCLLSGGQKVRVLERGEAFTKVRISDELIGYLSNTMITVADEELTALSVQEQQDQKDLADTLIHEQQVRESESVQQSIYESESVEQSIAESIRQSIADATRPSDWYDTLPKGYDPGDLEDLSELRRHIVLLACSCVKVTPYREDGYSLETGCDSSGFTMAIFRHFGIDLPHSSRYQRNSGTAVADLSQARPGDLICYDGSCGIYIGNGMIVRGGTEIDGRNFPVNKDQATYKPIITIRNVIGD